MQLSRFTDLGLRVLMYLTILPQDRSVTIGEIADKFQVSHHHLTKVVQLMGAAGWLINVRGKGGGIRLAFDPQQYALGDLVRTLERSEHMIDCAQPPCVLRATCALKGIFAQAKEAFLQDLNRHTLADAVSGAAGQTLRDLHHS